MGNRHLPTLQVQDDSRRDHQTGKGTAFVCTRPHGIRIAIRPVVRQSMILGGRPPLCQYVTVSVFQRPIRLSHQPLITIADGLFDTGSADLFLS